MTVLLGQTTAGTTADIHTPGGTGAYPYVAAASGTLAKIWCQFQMANASLTGVVLGIYSDSGTLPVTRLASAAVTLGALPTSTGLFGSDVSGAALSIVQGTTYWLAVGGTGGAQIDVKGTTATNVGKESTSIVPASWSNVGNLQVSWILWGEDNPPAFITTQTDVLNPTHAISSVR